MLATYAVDDLGRRTSLTRGNGTATSYGYDHASRPISLGQDLTGTANDLTISGFSYNPASQITGYTAATTLMPGPAASRSAAATTPTASTSTAARAR